jgi:hypothetical protein
MPHVFRAGAIVLACLGASCGLSGQTPDTRLDDAIKEIAQLKRIAADQDRRIAALENTVRSQQRAILAAARPAPALSWRPGLLVRTVLRGDTPLA